MLKILEPHFYDDINREISSYILTLSLEEKIKYYPHLLELFEHEEHIGTGMKMSAQGGHLQLCFPYP